MKLARPDIRHPRIVLVGSEGGDDAGLVAALRKRGLHARWLSWDDPDTLHADLVILRTITDYADRLDEFLAWTKRVPNLLNARRRRRLERRPTLSARSAPRRGADSGPPSNASAVRTALVYLGGTQSHALTRRRRRRSRPTSNCGTSGRLPCKRQPTGWASAPTSCSTPAPM